MLTDYFYPHVGGGVERVVYEVSKRLVKVGYAVVIITLNTKKAKGLEILEGVKIHRCGAINLTKAAGVQLTISPLAIFNMLKICRKEKPDIIHANNRFFFTTICGVLLRCAFKRPALITTFHLGPMYFEKGPLSLIIKVYEKTFSKLIIRKSDRIIAVSNAVKEHIISLGAPPNKVRVIPNGVDLNDFKPNEEKQRSSKGTRVVFVGRLIFNKGPHHLVEAAPKVLAKHLGVEFVIVGEGPMRSGLEETAKRFGVFHAFKFLGTVANVADVLKECDIFVRPSLTEGMPLTILEAMACGLPIVATRVAGTPEIIINESTGILINPGDVQQLANSILWLIDHPELSMKLGMNARKFVERHFSWDRTANLTMNVYEEILK